MGDKELTTDEVEAKKTQPQNNKGGSPLKIIVILLIITILAVGIAAYMGYVNIPGITPKKVITTPSPAPAPSPTPVPQPSPDEERPPPLPDEAA